MNRSFYITPDFQLVKKEGEIPTPKDNQVVVKIFANGICGSDVHQLFDENGLLGSRSSETYVTGHEASGTIYSVGSAVKNLSMGQKVVLEPGAPCGMCSYCKAGLYNHCTNMEAFLSTPGSGGTLCDYVAVRYDQCHLIPDDMDMEVASLAEPVAVGIHVVNRAGEVKGKTVAIFGAGPIGMVTMQCFKAAGCGKVIMIDINQKRLDFSKRVGADDIINSAETEIPENLVDISVECAGSHIAQQQLFSTTRPAGTCVQLGWAKQKALLDINLFNRKELTYRGSVVYAGEFPVAVKWLANGNIDGKALITHRFNFEDSFEAFKFARENPDEVIKALILN